MAKLSHIPLIFCLSFIFGVLLRVYELDAGLIWGGGAIGLAVAIFFYKKLSVKLLIISVVFFLLGFLLGLYLAHQSAMKLEGLRGQEISREVQFEAKIISEKEERDNYSRYIVKSAQYGKILVLTEKKSAYQYGDILKISGILEAPTNFSDFDYQGYLAKDSLYWIAPFPRLSLIGAKDLSLSEKFFRALFDLRQKIRTKLIKTFSLEQSSFLRAIILGDRGVISDEAREKLARSGTSHIVAISGLHLSILAAFVFGGFLILGLTRKQATALTLFLLILFPFFVGPRASVVRAAFMASLVLLALAFGKIFQGKRLIIYASFTMLLANPLLARYDVGFQLSFAAVLGIFLLKPALSYFFEQKLKLTQILSDILTLTLAAQLFTLPIVMAHFGVFSLIAPISNLFALLILPVILGLGFLWVFLAVLINPLPLSIILVFLLKYFLAGIFWFSNLSFAAVELSRKINLLWIFLYYLGLGVIVFFWQRFYQNRLTPLALWKKWQYEKKSI